MSGRQASASSNGLRDDLVDTLRQEATTAVFHLSWDSAAAEQARATVRSLDQAVKLAASYHRTFLHRGSSSQKRSNKKRSPFNASKQSSLASETKQMVIMASFNRLKAARTEATFAMGRANKAKLAAWNEAQWVSETLRAHEVAGAGGNEGVEEAADALGNMSI